MPSALDYVFWANFVTPLNNAFIRILVYGHFYSISHRIIVQSRRRYKSKEPHKNGQQTKNDGIKKMKKLLATTLLFALPCWADTVKININSHQDGPVINRNIYGQFAEHLGRGIYDGV